MLNQFEYAGRYDKKIKNYKFWQDGNEAKELITNAFMEQKLNYIHNNPKNRITDPIGIRMVAGRLQIRMSELPGLSKYFIIL